MDAIYYTQSPHPHPPPPPPPQPTFPVAIPLPVGYDYPQSGVYSPPPHTHYTEVPLSPDTVAIIGTVIGRGGFYFKKITEAARVHYIFYRPERSVVEVWGPEHSLRNAVGRINRRIQAAKDMLASRKNTHANSHDNMHTDSHDNMCVGMADSIRGSVGEISAECEDSPV